MTQWLLNNALPLIATVLLAYSYIPQLIKTYRTKSVDDVSPAFWWSISAALALMTVNAAYVFYLTGGYGYLITEIINLSLAVAMLTLVLRYHEKPLEVYVKYKEGNSFGSYTARNVAKIQDCDGSITFLDKRSSPISWHANNEIISIRIKREGFWELYNHKRKGDD